MADISGLELYAFWRSSATFRVRVALNLKGLTAHEHFINMDAGEQRSAAYLKINPLGGIPSLVEPGHAPITQSLAILEFLEEAQPTPPLLPSDLHGRARVRSLAGMLVSDTPPLITPRVRKQLASGNGTGNGTGSGNGNGNGIDDAAWKTWQTHWFSTGLAALEQRLATEADTGDFCHGDQPTMADICLASIMSMVQVLKISVADIPTIDRILARCNSLDAFARAQPARQAGAPA
jgi:maleylacetoacetate isomerase